MFGKVRILIMCLLLLGLLALVSIWSFILTKRAVNTFQYITKKRIEITNRGEERARACGPAFVSDWLIQNSGLSHWSHVMALPETISISLII